MAAPATNLYYRKISHNVQVEEERKRFEERLKLQSTPEHTAKGPASLDDYDVIRTLGTGSFGRVVLSKNRATGEYVAIKVLKKERVVKTKQVEHTISEKKMLASVSHPYVVNLLSSFQDTRNLYLVLEYVNGGEMFTHLHRFGRFTSDVARFYVAEVVLAFEYLHDLDIVYRDLKPENLLLDHHGHVRITDFGFAKRVTDRTWTLCGTPEYLAPEIILSRGYGHAVDWWALGILIYEFLTGGAPFVDDNPMGIYEKIIIGKIIYPNHLTKEEKHLISKLCTGDLTKRFGNIKGGVSTIKSHAWFDG
eukprot:Colp12_sorted_trinity150504_noHs@23531